MNRILIYLMALTVTLSSCASCTDSSKDEEVPESPYKLNYIEVEEHDNYGKIYLYGLFANKDANSKVKIGNKTFTVYASEAGQINIWTNAYIVVDMNKDFDNMGGDVTVFTGGTETNKRVLQVWHGIMKYREPDEGTLVKEVEINFNLRADSKPNTQPVTIVQQSSFFDISRAFCSIGGEGSSFSSSGGVRVRLDQMIQTPINMDEPYIDRTAMDTNFQCLLKFKDRKFVISKLNFHIKNFTKKRTLPSGSTVETVVDFPFQVQVLPTNGTLTLEFEGDTDVIKAGSWTSERYSTQYGLYWDASEAVNHFYNKTLVWERMEPRFK